MYDTFQIASGSSGCIPSKYKKEKSELLYEQSSKLETKLNYYGYPLSISGPTSNNWLHISASKTSGGRQLQGHRTCGIG